MPEISFDRLEFEPVRGPFVGRATLVAGLAGVVGAGLAPCLAAPARLPRTQIGYQATPHTLMALMAGSARCHV
jgi:hypothetical protein